MKFEMVYERVENVKKFFGTTVNMNESWADSVPGEDEDLGEVANFDVKPDKPHYVSKKFGMNRFQKVNQELETKCKILEEKYNKKVHEYETLKVTHNKVMLEKSQKSIQFDQTTTQHSQELKDVESLTKQTSQEVKTLEKELKESKTNIQGLTNELAAKTHENELKNKEIGEASTRYSQLKEKYMQLEELYNSKVSSSNSTEVTIAELSNQITLKNGQLEKLKQETLELRKSTQEYRDQNTSYRKYLEDKDKFIQSLNATIDDYTFQIENGLTKKSEPQPSKRTLGTPRVVTLSEPIRLSVQAPPRSGNKTGRGVPSQRRL